MELNTNISFEIDVSTIPSKKEEGRKDDSVITTVSKKENKINIEIGNTKEYYVSQELFKQKGFIDSEPWDEPINIQAQIIKFDKKSVICNCAIDVSQNVFQTRIFPIKLFQHLNNIQPSKLILIRVKEKPGSSRIDIIDGSNNVVDSKIFDKKNKWDVLKNTNLEGKIEGDIEL